MNTEANVTNEPDLHEALSQSICAILRMHFSASRRLTAEQNAEVKRRLADGSARIALFVTHDGKSAEASVALIGSEVRDVFTNHMLKLQGPLLSAIAPAEAVQAINLNKLN